MDRRDFLTFSSLLISSGATTSFAQPYDVTHPDIDSETAQKIRFLTSIPPEERDENSRLPFISERFLGTPYLSHHLIGSKDIPEKLIIDLRSVDCLSFLEYVIALNLSHNIKSFINSLIQTRYIDRTVSFTKRRHFLSDWYECRTKIAYDVTRFVSDRTVAMNKSLNKKADNSLYLPGVEIKERTIAYIPSAYFNDVSHKIRNGDIIGIYSPLPGLDVSHTGLAIWKNKTLFFRNASSLKKNNCVVDSVLETYLQKKVGFTVVRPVYDERIL